MDPAWWVAPQGPANITIPVDQVPVIQTAIINAGVQAEIIFFFIGLGIAFAFSYLYFRMWRSTVKIVGGSDGSQSGGSEEAP